MSLSVDNLTKRFTAGGTPAVSEVSFTAPSGGITALLGPSGSGKSTVLRMIAGLEQPDAGRVLFGDRDCTAVPTQDRGVGFVFQSYALFKHMNVRRNIAFGMNVRKRPKAEVNAKVDELLALVQLDGLGERYPSQLSGGQRQRVAFARALAIEPKLLLLDEPFGALDAQVRVELRDWLRRFHDTRDMTTLIVTHDQEEAMEVSDHVVVMQGGRVAQAGSTDDVYDRPASPFVASFVGGANVLRGHVTDGRITVGAMTVGAQASDGVPAPLGARDAAAVSADVYVRPHDVTLTKVDGDAPSVAAARVERLVRLGAKVKLSLKLHDGAPMTVEMTKMELDALAIGEGDLVLTSLRDAKIFLGDYSI
ncbi:MAG TPA: sulfate/molybdate ABC transporter ATP-binding protein [Polyangia bacterium]|jgi:sulfate transport system ATP-binding protein|nr:sulfate/molybdate ABC transporter ATP-binding protein [Polyangia bacterium]